MKKNSIILLLLIIVIGLPFLFRQEYVAGDDSDETLVILTPHNEAVRYEFTQGFQKWYYKKTGKTVFIDWRVPGGTQNAIRYVDSVYANAFRLYWENDLDREWTPEVQDAFFRRADYENHLEDSLICQVRDIFDKTALSCGIDLFLGGGKVDVVVQAKKGQIVPMAIFESHPEWFDKGNIIPHEFRGNIFWDKEKRWVGTALSVFGIIFNRQVLENLNIKQEPQQWIDLTAEEYCGEIALSDPMASASFTMAFEVILQQQMQQAWNEIANEAGNDEKAKQKALSEGWLRGMGIIQKISANSRYFTDAATKPVLDVSIGGCAVGMAIDFYGLFQVENLKMRSGSKRFGFVMPKGGSAVSPDPVAMFRGAPNTEPANAFIEYILSVEGQKLWDYKVGTPGGPIRYALNRAPIRKELYESAHVRYRSNPDINLYLDTEGFTYYPRWTSKLFKEIRFVIKVAFIDVHRELGEAWRAIIQARKAGRVAEANEALLVMDNLEGITYEDAWGSLKKVLHSGDPLKEIKLQAEISRKFRDHYRIAEEIANRGKD